MIPALYEDDDFILDFVIVPHKTKTYKVSFDGKPSFGMLDGVEALKQTIYMILHAERYKWPVFSWNYGVELEKCFGQADRTLLMLDIQRGITDALKQDERVKDVTDFQFSFGRKNVQVSFLVDSTEGEITSEQIFDIGMEVPA